MPDGATWEDTNLACAIGINIELQLDSSTGVARRGRITNHSPADRGESVCGGCAVAEAVNRALDGCLVSYFGIGLVEGYTALEK